MKTVRDIMSPIVYCLDENTFLPEAAKALRDRGISGAPVINADKQYVGVISQTDINAKFAKCMEDENSFKAGWVEGRVPSLESVMVKDIMTRQVLRISADATIEELGKSLLVGGVHRLLVAEEGEVVGIVSTTDLIHGFLNPRSENESDVRRPGRQPYLFETALSMGEDAVYVKGSFGEELALEPPPEFGGKGQFMSPEDIFVASISSCLCLTFKEFAKRANLEVHEYKCRAIGRLEGDGVSQRFTRVDLYPRIKVSGSVEQTERILTQAKLRCLVGRSSDVIAVLHPKIECVPFQEI